ncbi:hypothetical protein [uncultured Treponema sp.]|uniref:hypothetical protein n=1 Tax=uncultured Treponema sp. TaxID=162155 RepID=UPI0025F844EA|nr:hypothetical protein [uncultured Treponema sp.]
MNRNLKKGRFFLPFILLLLTSLPLHAEEAGAKDESFSQAESSLPQEEKKETEGRKRIFSLDFSALILGLSNNGWGLGCSYEQYLVYHTAFKAGFQHCTFIRDGSLFPTVNFSLAAEYYPLSNSLDKLYLSLGGAMDYLAYTTTDYGENIQSNFISIITELGWKWRFQELVAIDIHAGYKYIFKEEDKTSPHDYEKYLRKGIVWGASVKFNLGKIIRKIF